MNLLLLLAVLGVAGATVAGVTVYRSTQDEAGTPQAADTRAADDASDSPTDEELDPGFPESHCPPTEDEAKLKTLRYWALRYGAAKGQYFSVARGVYAHTGTIWTPDASDLSAASAAYVEVWAHVAGMPDCFTSAEVEKARRITAGATR